MSYPVYAESSLTGRKALWIKNPDDHTDAYHVELEKWTGEAIVRGGGSQGPTVGRIKFDVWQHYAEIWFKSDAGKDDVRVEMRKEGLGTTTDVVDIPAAAPRTSPFRWLSTGFLGRGDVKLVDAKGANVSVFEKSRGWGSKVGSLRIADNQLSREVVDQIVVTFVAIEEKRRRQGRSSVSAGCGGPVTAGFGVGGL